MKKDFETLYYRALETLANSALCPPVEDRLPSCKGQSECVKCWERVLEKEVKV